MMQDRLPYLDGLRGYAALYVMCAHVALLTGWHSAWVRPTVGVFLFMMLSGFLMVYHYRQRESREPWHEPRTWRRFWLRRFFRIAPLYYVLLAVALAAGPWLGEARVQIGQVFPETQTSYGRYHDAGMGNIFMHVSFLFGLLPSYAFRTPLPDWSIGLEMQFYALFPFLMLLIRRMGPLGGSALILAATWGAQQLMKLWGVGFPMPSFLPLTMAVFLLGMLLAYAQQHRHPWRYVALACVVSCAPLYRNMVPVQVMLLFFTLCVFHDQLRPLPLIGTVSRVLVTWLSRSFNRYLGDLSYGVYLWHLLVAIPVVAGLLHVPGYVQLPDALRWCVAMLLVGPVACLLAHCSFKGIEQPGIHAGHRWLTRRASEY